MAYLFHVWWFQIRGNVLCSLTEIQHLKQSEEKALVKYNKTILYLE